MENKLQDSINGGNSGQALTHDPLAENAVQGGAKEGTIARQRTIKKVAPAILLVCLALAILTVLLVPLLVGGAAPAASRIVSSSVPEVAKAYNSVEEAQQVLGFAPVVPASMPSEYTCTAVRVKEGNILEIEYSSGKNLVFFRTAEGSDDLSADTTEYYFTTTETLGNITRSYAGVADKKLSTAVWADNNRSYAVVAPDGIAAAQMRQIAESVA